MQNHVIMFNKYSASKFTVFVLMLAVTLFVGCKKNDDVKDNPPTVDTPVITNDATKVSASVTGSVIDENNQPVANAAVTAGTYSTVTDAMGNFIFKNVNISAANGNVTVVKAGYFKGIRSFVTDAGKNNYVKIQLLKQVVTGTVSNATGGVVNTLTGAAITFPANAFVTTAGAAFTGNVTVYAQWIDPTAANLPLIVPGDLRGLDSSNAEFVLKSYGMVGAEFKDNSGNTLKIAPGKMATISFPIPTALQSAAPPTIALWHFDEAAARWKKEGTATKSGNTYTAQVNKFSFWNVDVPANFINLDLRLINSANNLPLANTMIKITDLASNTSRHDFTNDSGYVSGYIPKNENLKLEVIAGTACNTNTIIYTQNIGPYTANTSLGNISVTLPANLVINFTATVKDCSNLPVANGYVSLSLANGTSAMAFTNATGVVNFSLIHCGGTPTYSYNAVDLATGNYSATATGTAATNTVNLGTVTACGNAININGVYIAGSIGDNAVLWKDGVPTFLTNSPTNSPNFYAEAKKVLVYNNDVYVLGQQDDSTVNGYIYTIKVWKNGVVTNEIMQADATGLDVYNGDIYVCGEQNNNTSTDLKVWKNGIASILTKDTFSYVETHAIKIVNGDVYVIGSGYNNQIPGTNNYGAKAIYWKNGVINVLSTTGFKGSADNIYSFNGDVYIVGSEQGPNQTWLTVYWKNGVKTTLPLTGSYTSSRGTSIFIDNSNIYTVGQMRYSNSTNLNYSNAAYWKNGTVNLLTNYSTNLYEAEFYDIFVKNNIVYTVGDSYKNTGSAYQDPLYFQNGVAVPLTGFTSNQGASAYSIFVK